MSRESYYERVWESLNRQHVEDEREPEMSEDVDGGGLMTETDEESE